MTTMMDFRIGDNIVYDSAAALNLPAKIINIDIAKNAAGDHIPWITVEFDNISYGDPRYPNAPKKASCRLAAIPSNIKIMKIRKA